MNLKYNEEVNKNAALRRKIPITKSRFVVKSSQSSSSSAGTLRASKDHTNDIQQHEVEEAVL